MAELRIQSSYEPLPRQEAFHRSKAKIVAYGGAMGGGKSRALCEDVFQDMLDHPGIQIPVFRFTHVSIGLTTKRTMLHEVIPPELLRHCQRKSSGGEDFLRLPNGSTVYFAGLDDPERWFSSEIGGVGFDEAHQITEEAVVKLISRLRQRGMPGRVRLCFNPENPGHWLYRWFIADAEETETGFRKDECFPLDASRPIGDCQFVFAKATDNPYLPDGYVDENLAGMPELLRRRYLEGEWLYVSGTAYFDVEAMTEYAGRVAPLLYRCDLRPLRHGMEARVHRHKEGKVSVYAEPDPDHSYAIGADPASGSGKDSSAAFVVDLGTMEFVAEFHGRLDEDLFAEQLHFLGRWYSRSEGERRVPALLGVEHQGGFGNATIINLRDGKGGRPPYPNMYRHKLELQVDLQTTKRWGYPVTLQTRTMILTGLEAALRERSLPYVTRTLLDQCATFVNHETGTSPRAQEGCRDDAVMAAALALELYRMRGRHPDRDRRIEARRALRPPRRRTPAFPWLRG